MFNSHRDSVAVEQMRESAHEIFTELLTREGARRMMNIAM